MKKGVTLTSALSSKIEHRGMGAWYPTGATRTICCSPFLGLIPDTDCFRVFCCQLFALAYLAGIASRTPDLAISSTPFFSVQTMASIGYGVMYPLTVYANAMVAIEALRV